MNLAWTSRRSSTNIARFLDGKTLRYALIGGLAMHAYGFSRLTSDKDLRRLAAPDDSSRLDSLHGHDRSREFGIAGSARRITPSEASVSQIAMIPRNFPAW
jgi:hypothetical protein